MKKLSTLVCAAALAALPVMAETITFNDNAEINHSAVRPTDDGFKIISPAWAITAKSVKFDKFSTYRISAEIKCDNPNAQIRLAIYPIDAEGVNLGPINVFAVDGTENFLAEDVNIGDKTIKVKDVSKLKNVPSAAIVYDVDPTGRKRDMPNRNELSRVDKIDMATGVITLSSPAKVALGADTPIRLHQASWSAMGFLECDAGKEWKTFSFKTVFGVSRSVNDNPRFKMWPYAVAFKPLIITNAPCQFRNLKVEVID